MYLLQGFLGEKYGRVNRIIESFNNVQNNYINLVACCSYPFPSVLEAQRYPIFTLPTEGVRGNRYFPTFESIEDIDQYAEELVRELFAIGDEYCVSTQPHSGTQANQIVYNSILSNGDIVLSLSSKDGGHISHNKISNKQNEVINYSLTSQFEIDYEQIEQLIIKHSPKLVIVGTSSFPNEINFKRIAEIAHSHDALLLADICHTVLYIMARTYPNVFPYADFVTFTMDKTLRGPQGGMLVYRKKYEKQISYSIFPVSQGGPLQSLQFAKMLALVELKASDIKEYAKTVQRNAKMICDILVSRSIPVVSGTTSTHIVLIDVSQLNLTGQIAENHLYDNNILVNKNLVPNDKKSPEVTSGIRLGSVCISNLDYSSDDIGTLANIVADLLLNHPIDKAKLACLIQKYHVSISS